MKNITIISAILVILSSCDEPITEESLFTASKSETAFTEGSLESLAILKKKPRRNEYVKDPASYTTETDQDGNQYYVDENGKRVYLPPLLPASYNDRDFLKLANTYDINDLAGGIVKLENENEDEKFYKLASLERYAKDTGYPETIPIEEGVIYSEKINKSVKFSASYLIANISVSDDKLKEVIVTDVSRTNLKLGEFDTQRLGQYYGSLSEEEKNKYYIIKSVVLTVINHRDFSKTEFKAGVDGQFFNAGGETFSSSENMKATRTISVDLVALSDVL